MFNIALIDAFRKIEVEEGFEAAFNALWGLSEVDALDEYPDTVAHEMQRWALLYPDEYERICRELGIDTQQFEIE